MRKFVLAALVALSGAGAAVAGDFVIPVDKDFTDGDITWDSQERAYEFKWAVRENKSGLYVCGVGKFTVAALNRAQTAIKTYPDAPAHEEALFLMIKAYDLLAMNDLRDDTERIMRKNFPKSEYFVRGLGTPDPWWKLW